MLAVKENRASNCAENEQQLTSGGSCVNANRRRRNSHLADDVKTAEKLDSLVKEQVVMIKEGQKRLSSLVEAINLSDHKVTLDTMESIQNTVNKSEDLIVLVQIIIKVRNELGHARLDLENLKKTKRMIPEGEQRVRWLEQKLEKLLIDCHEQSSNLLYSTKHGVAKGVDLTDSNLQTFIEGRLTPAQRERVFCDVGGYTRSHEDQTTKQKYCKMASGVVGASQKMIPKPGDNAFDDAESSTASQEGGSPEPDQASSYNGDHPPEMDNQEEEGRGLTGKRVSWSHLSSEHGSSNTESKIKTESSELSSEDEVDRYWKSDHHKFEWAEGPQSNPISWHALGISVQDSFITKEKPNFSEDLPWIEKATQVNSVVDIHKIALDRLYAKLHNVYDCIERATEASINPTFKSDKIETRMGNIESIPSALGNKTISQGSVRVSRDGDRSEQSDRLSTVAAKSVSFLNPFDHDVPPRLFTPVVKTPDQCYPRSPGVWCASQTWKGRIVKKITTNRPVRPSKTITAKKFEKTEVRQSPNKQERAAAEAMVWRPSIVYKMIRATKVLKVFQSQLQQWNVARSSDPKWKRVNWLLGTSGLNSATKEIVISALKTLSELKCSEEEVGEAVRNIISTSQDPRIVYEASKTLILSGHWDAIAVKTLLNALRSGSKCLKMEILDALMTVTDLPFFDRETQLFKELKDCLSDLVQGHDAELAFTSALCLGRVFIADPVAKKHLMKVVQSHGLSSKDKGQALDLLVRDMHCKDDIIVRALLHELNTSINWQIRVEAAELLIYLGERHVLAEDPESVFQVLDRLLWDHAHQDVRSKVAELVNTLRWRQKACDLVLKRLDDPEASVRGRAIISLATLEMKGGKELKALLDILALDSSVYARVQAVRAFSKLQWNDPRVLRSLKEREKGEGILAKEARKAIRQILEPAGR